MNQVNHKNNHIKSFVLRGRTTNSQKKYMSFYDEYKFDPSIENDPIVLDIGSGMGNYIVAEAELNPDLTLVAVEPNSFCIGSILKMLIEKELKNLKVAQMDVIDIIKTLKPKLKLVQIFFPDPWPKSKHHKRRLIKPDFINLLLPHMTSDAHLHIKTDDASYALSIVETMSQFPQFIAEKPPTKILTTKYEARGLRLGNTINDFYFKLV